MSLNNQLIEITDANRHAIETIPQLQDMLSGQFTRQRYINFLIQLYPVVSHFCPLMAAAASRCADRYPELRNYLYEHIVEEKGHEQMVLDDLDSMCVDSFDVPSQLPSPPVQAMLGFNYHNIAAIDPHSVLGLVYVLEIVSSVYGGRVAQAVSRTVNLPLAQGFSFLESHASLDDEHLGELRKAMQSVQESEVEDVVLSSVRTNFYLFRQVLGYPDKH
jgi:pyrroloquinoline quinone (PQQ) biosynthesis protein C